MCEHKYINLKEGIYNPSFNRESANSLSIWPEASWHNVPRTDTSKIKVVWPQ